MKKGQKKRVWTPEQKAEIVHKHLDEHVSVRTLEKEYTADRSMICRWVKDYIAEGETAFIPKGHPGNPFAALHVSKNLSEFRKVFCKFSIKVCKPRRIRCFTVICKNKIILFLAKFLHLKRTNSGQK